MTTLDIRDFGAEVDGKTDDTEAVRDTLDAASRGDTVFFPAGTTRVGDGYKRSVWMDSTHSGITLKGTGESSIIKQAGGHTANNQVLYIEGDTNPEDITIRDLRVHGNRANNSALTTIGVLAWPPGKTSNILIENVWVEQCSESGIQISTGNVTIRNCTTSYCGRHGVNPDTSDPNGTIRVEDVLSHHNDKYGIDDSCGDTVIDGFVIHNCTYGMKHTADTEQSIVRNGRIRDCDTNGYATIIPNHKWPSSRPDITIDNVISEGNSQWGFRFDENADYTVGAIEARENNQDGKVAQVGMFNNSSVDAQEIHSYDSVSGAGVYFTSSRNSTIDTYFHAGNPDGGLNKDDSGGKLSVNAVRNKRASNISVPTEDEVGAGNLSSDNPATAIETVAGVMQSTDGVLGTR